MKMIIAISTKGFDNWNGGFEFLKFHVENLMNVKPDFEIAFLTPIPKHNTLRKVKQKIKRFFGVSYPENLKGKILELAQVKGISTYNYKDDDTSLNNLLNEISASILYLTSFPYKVSIPVLGYIPDLQHVHLQKFFKRKELKFRDRLFNSLLVNSDLVIVNSRDTKKDLVQFYKVSSLEIETIPFLPTQFVNSFIKKEQITRKYCIKQQTYFHIPNQLWVHKDHITAIRALSLLRADCPDVAIVCTGSKSDFRNPDHYNKLNDILRKLDLENNVYFLGLIEKLDMLSIMETSIAVVQPTLFEGGPGGGAAYEAISNGVPLILSDILINQEVKGKNVRYFKVGDHVDLSCRMREIIKAPPERPDKDQLKNIANQNRLEIGRILLKHIEKAILLHSKKQIF